MSETSLRWHAVGKRTSLVRTAGTTDLHAAMYAGTGEVLRYLLHIENTVPTVTA